MQQQQQQQQQQQEEEEDDIIIIEKKKVVDDDESNEQKSDRQHQQAAGRVAAPNAGVRPSNDDDDKNDEQPYLPPFVTTSSVLQHLNENLQKLSTPNDIYQPKFELQKRLPDGSSIPCNENDIAASDLQTKIQQCATIVAALPTLEEKYSWAEQQRLAGNVYFNHGDYKSAMDIYLTCLLVVNKQTNGKNDESGSDNSNKERHQNDSDNDDDDDDIFRPMMMPKGSGSTTASSSSDGGKNDNTTQSYSREFITQVYTPVLNNLAQCTLQLGMYRKAITFCTLGLEQQQEQQDARQEHNEEEYENEYEEEYMLGLCKLYYKRGKARRLTGEYKLSRVDLQHAMERLQDLVTSSSSRKKAAVETNNNESTNYQVYEKAIQKELRYLEQAEREGRRNRQRAKKAMQQILSSSSPSSTLTTPPTNKHSSGGGNDSKTSGSNATAATTNKDDNQNNALNDGATSSTTTTAEIPSIYNTEQQPRQYSKLRNRKKHSSNEKVCNSKEFDDKNDAAQRQRYQQLTYAQYYWLVVARVAEQLLEWIGDDDVGGNEEEEVRNGGNKINQEQPIQRRTPRKKNC